MDAFEQYSPTRIYFGENHENHVGEYIKKEGGSKVLVVYGGQSAKKSGLLDKVTASLEKSGLSYALLGGVVPNPRLGLVHEGIGIAKKEGVDFVLAVGGGSVIDTVKAVAAGAVYNGEVWDFFSGKALPQTTLPTGSVLTIAAAGSESSNSCVITNEDGWLKVGLRSDTNRPKFAVLNPALTKGLPPYQVACGVVDIFMHTAERYFSKGFAATTDAIAESVMRYAIYYGNRLYHNPADDEARSEIMYMGSISHNGLTGLGKAGDWTTHHMEHEIGGMFDVAHGAGLAAVWPAWAKYVYQSDLDCFVKFAVNVCGMPHDPADPEATALAGIQYMVDFFHSIDMPITLAELGLKDVTEAQIAEMAEKCTHGDTTTEGSLQVLNMEDVKQIYRNAR